MFREANNRKVRGRKRRLLLKIGVVLCALFIVAVTVAWMFPGFVESPGFLEPDSRVALYAPASGVVRSGELKDGLYVNRGDVILVIDQEWTLWNLKRVRQEIVDNRENLALQKVILERFMEQRSVEEEELRRLLELEKSLVELTPQVNVIRRQYNYDSFFASAEREQAEIEQKIEEISRKGLALLLEEELWERRLSRYRLSVPVSGTFYTLRTLLPEARDELLPEVGPGYYVDEGGLLGYVIPDDSIKVVIRIPQAHVARLKVGQHVLVSMAALPAWRFRPLYGKLVSVSPVASAGYFRGKVEISSVGRTNEEIKNLYFGDLVARIRVSEISGHGWLYYLWESWTVLINSIGEY